MNTLSQYEEKKTTFVTDIIHDTIKTAHTAHNTHHMIKLEQGKQKV